MAYDRCYPLSGEAKLSCQLDKALANVGAILAKEVEGRVCTEVDPRLADDKDMLVKKAQTLLSQYEEMKVPKNKLIFRLPGTWAGIQAAAALEKQGVATQVFHIYSLIQGIAAAQAGVSVIQPNVGRTRDWYNKHPGVIRDRFGPREDTGFTSSVDPGILLAKQLYDYVKTYHPESQIMASGLRTKEDALALAGCDYLVVSSKIMSALEATPTLQGYNNDLSADALQEALERQLSPESARENCPPEFPAVDESKFNSELNVAAKELLRVGLEGLKRDVQSVLPYFTKKTLGTE
eukprot:jgi/Chrzof1/9702/Cz04g12210.t1